MERYDENFREELAKAQDMYSRAERLKRLELFLPPNIPDDGYELWSKLTKGGSLARQGTQRPGESPKITYKRFVQKKIDEYNRLKKEFEQKYNMSYKNIDVDKSGSMEVFDVNGEKLAPLAV